MEVNLNFLIKIGGRCACSDLEDTWKRDVIREQRG